VSAPARSRHALALRLLPLLDLTSLGEDDTPARIEALCASARSCRVLPAALCVYPEHVTTARRALHGTAMRVATVVNFPDGGSDPDRGARETRRALAAGADEIDLVLPWRSLPAGRPAEAEAVVRACREACGPETTLKLILEAGQLHTPALVNEACRIGLACGVDFLKTSTGKAQVGATPEAAALMLAAIAGGGGRCGFKAAGGIRTLDEAAVYLDLAESRMGADWIDPVHFRIGASALYAQLLAALDEPHGTAARPT
jgi:deoxyribose-phosphate aldolase